MVGADHRLLVEKADLVLGQRPWIAHDLMKLYCPPFPSTQTKVWPLGQDKRMGGLHRAPERYDQPFTSALTLKHNNCTTLSKLPPALTSQVTCSPGKMQAWPLLGG